jgi:hypothetical protein
MVCFHFYGIFSQKIRFVKRKKPFLRKVWQPLFGGNFKNAAPWIQAACFGSKGKYQKIPIKG